MMFCKSPFGRTLLHTGAIFAVLCAHGHVAKAEPQGGTVTSGSAGIATSGSTTTITQSSDRAIIRWDSFDINSSEHVQFLQPSTSSITVNRIRDFKPSIIDGKISANGNIVLINPNGMVFGAGSVIDVGSLVATTSDLADDNAFMAGGAVQFNKPGNINARVIANGSITVRDAGLVGLVAPNVENNGIIQARLGKVQLASGDIHTIDFAGDGLIKLEVSEDVVSQSVKNTGTIIADGGEILLTAAAARHVVNTLVSNTGTLRADTVTMPDGEIKKGSIEISTRGIQDVVADAMAHEPAPMIAEVIVPTIVINSGTIQANGDDVGETGGRITLLADSIFIEDGSLIEASGDVGGGEILIGGDYQGSGEIPTSDLIYVANQAIINANSRRRGNGGKIIFWSDENTRFYGHASATGGSESGDGGLIEISGKKFLDFEGTVNLLAPYGQRGTLLLDPTNISISTGSNSNISGSSPFTSTIDDTVSILNITTLQAALAAGNVIVQTRATGSDLGTITVNGTISWSSGNTLTLDAHDAIIVNSTIFAGAGSLTMIAGADVQLNANISGTGTITIRQANDALTMGIAGGAGVLNLSTADLNRIADGWGSIVLGRATSTVTTTAFARTWTDNLTILSGTGALSITGTQTMGGNTINLTSAGGNIGIAGITSTNGPINVTSGGGTISVTSAMTSTGAVTLNSSGGTITTSSTIGSGALSITTGGGGLTIGSNITATGITNINSAAGTINLNAALNTGTNALTITTTGTNFTTNGSGVITSGTLGITTAGGNIVTGAAITSSGIITLNSGAGLLTLGGATSSGTNAMNLTTAARNITTGALTSGALTINSNGGNISTGAITASGNSSLTSGNGTILIGGTAAFGTNSLTLTTTGFNINTAAITSGALTMSSGGGNITTTGIVAASGATNLNSGGGSINLNAAFGSGTNTLTLTSGGGTITTLAGTISSGALNITTAGGNLVVGGAIAATGIGTINTGAGTVSVTGNLSTGTAALGITTMARTITTAAITSGALTLASGGANISTGAITTTGATSYNSGNGTITITGTATTGANALSLTTTGFAINTAAITSGNLTLTSAGGIITTTGAVAATGTSTINSGGAAMNLQAAFGSTGAMALTTGGGTLTKGTGALTSAALTITTANGNIAIGGAITATGIVSMNSGTGSVSVTGAIGSGANAVGITTVNNTITTNGITSGALTLTSGGGLITINGTNTNAAVNITSGGGNVTVNGAISTAGSVLNITSAGGNINKAAALTTTTGAITLNSGGGTITVGTGGITSTSGAVTLNSGAGVITVNSVINPGSGALNIITDGDISLTVTDSLRGTGALTISQFSTGTSIAIGDTQTGAIKFTNTEFGYIRTDFSSRTFGRIDGTGTINVDAKTWGDSLTLRSGSGVISLNGAQTFGGNSFTVQTDGDLHIGGALTGTGTLTILPTTATTSIGIGTGQTGDIAFTDAERAFLTNTWASVIIGSLTASGDINVGTTTWADPMTFRNGAGNINFNGNQTMGTNALTVNTNGDVGINGLLTGSAALVIAPNASSATTIGIGTGQGGVMNFSDAELTNIQFGWSGITIGVGTGTGSMDIGAHTWADHLTLNSGTGTISIHGTQTMTANNNLTINTNANLDINAGLVGSGTGVLTITGAIAASSIGLGNGTGGTINLDDAEVAYLQGTWANMVFGTTSMTGAMTIGALTWNDNAIFRTSTGLMTVSGDQTATTGVNLTFSTDSNLALNGNLSGSSTSVLNIRASSNGVIMALGDGQTGAVQVSAAELARIQSGWSNVTFGHNALVLTTGTINVGAMTWNNNVIFTTNTAAININEAQNMGAYNLTFSTNGDPLINAGLTGTGNLLFQSMNNAAIMGIGTGQAGAIQLSNSDLGNILNGWNSIIFGNTSTTAAMNIGAYTWQYDTIFRTNTGIITIAGDQSGKNLTYETNANMAINAALAGTGTLTIRGATTTSSIGLAGATGTTIIIDAAELNRITDGWNLLVFGRSNATGVMTVNAKTWNDNVQLITGSGAITIAQAQNLGANNLTISTNSNLVLNNTLTGTGNLVIEGSVPATTINLVTAGGTLNLTLAELNQIADGWNSIRFGSILGTGNMNVGAYTWKDNATFITNGNIVVSGLQNATAGTNLVYATLAGSFQNTTGSATPITAGAGGRYLIYSVSAGSDSYGSFTPPSPLLQKSYFNYSPDMVIEAGNHILYSSGAAKILYLKIDDKSKIYGDTEPTYTYTYLGGLQGGDTLGAALTAATLTATGASTTDSVGVLRTITGIFTTALGYATQVIDGVLSITKAPVLVTTNNATQSYGDANPGATVIYTGLRNGETDAVIDTLATATSGTDHLTDAGTYSIVASGAIDNNYTFNYSAGTLTINKAVLTVTTQNATREYYSANPTMTAVYTGFKNGEDENVIDTLATITSTAVIGSNVNNYAINAASALDNNYSFTYANTGLLSVTKATLTGTTQDATREYGVANPTMNIVYTGFKGSDTAAVVTTPATLTTTALIGSDVGLYDISATGANSTNYNFVYANTGKMNVTQATLTATTQNASREYGLANTGLSIVYTGYRNGDDVNDIDTLGTASSAANLLTGAGSVVSITGSGAVDNNYIFNYVNTGNLTITKATLTATTQNVSREYGLTNPALSVAYTGFRNTDTDTDIDTLAVATTSAGLFSNVGSYGISSSGAFDNNYTFSYANTGLLNVTQATINVTSQSATREYGLSNPGLTLDYTGFRNGEDISVINTMGTASTTATILTDVGNYAVTGGGASDNNYTFNYIDSGVLSITKAMLTATSQNATREYGAADPTYTFVYTGYRNSDDDSDIDVLATGSTPTATILSNVGTYGINGGSASDNNYNFAYVNTGNLSVTKAMLTATTQNATREYGLSNPAMSIVYTGYRNGDDDADLTTLGTATTAATIFSNVGTYGITGSGAVDDNYDFTYVDSGNLSITQATLTATTQNATREYGLSNPGMTIVYTGYRNGDDDADIDTLGTAVTAADTFSNVGLYAITGGGASDNNYTFTYANSGNLNITKANLTATSQNATREYGLSNPGLAIVYTGFRNGDDDADIDTLGTATTAATIFSNVGSYGITGSGAIDNNYDFTYAHTGSLNITKATLNVTPDFKFREISEPDPAFTATYTGFRNGDDDLDIDVLATMVTSATGASPIGDYAITASGALDNNYDFTYTPGVFSIVLDSSTPPPPPPPPPPPVSPPPVSGGSGTGTPSVLPPTAEINNAAPATIVNGPVPNLFVENTSVNLSYVDIGGIVVLQDEDLYSEQERRRYLIAISKNLQDQYIISHPEQ